MQGPHHWSKDGPQCPAAISCTTAHPHPPSLAPSHGFENVLGVAGGGGGGAMGARTGFAAVCQGVVGVDEMGRDQIRGKW